MKILLEKLSLSVDHLKCLDETLLENHTEYKRIETIFSSPPFDVFVEEISKELYAGGKQLKGQVRLHRQMILSDVIQYIFTGRAFYYAAKSPDKFKNFLKLILYCVNQILIFDTITVDPSLRKKYIEKLETSIPLDKLYEKAGDKEVAQKLKVSATVVWDKDWTPPIDFFVDSILPKTLGCPKELVVFGELIRLQKGMVIPLLIIQRILGDNDPIAPPDFLLLRGNKEIFGIELGYKKELQSREFSIRTSIPTFAVDLENNLHNRCPKCGENILYCDPVIEAYSDGTLDSKLNAEGKYLCKDCPQFDNGNCKFSNYYGFRNGSTFYGSLDGEGPRHYHAHCVVGDTYSFRKKPKPISGDMDYFFAQIPKIQGLGNL